MGDRIKRRAFITAFGVAAMHWPVVAWTQQRDVRRVAVLMLYVQNDPEGQARAVAFQRGLEERGWSLGRNVQIDYRWGIGDTNWIRSAANELLEQAPDVIVANGPSAVRPMQQLTRTVPIIFIAGADPVREGFVQSLAHPGGNMTGFAVLESTIGPKLLELLKEIAPQVTRVGFIINPDSSSALRLSDATAVAAKRLGIELVALHVREAAHIETAIRQLDNKPAYGLIVPPDPVTNSHRKLIIDLATRYQLPAIYALRAAAMDGGLMSYGIDITELFRQAADYADRVMRGEKPADLPVQQPTKFELVINVKTAKVLNLTVPQTLLLRADEVIQ